MERGGGVRRCLSCGVAGYITLSIVCCLKVVELLSVALRAVLALAAIAFCLFSSVVQVTFIIFFVHIYNIIR